MRFEPILNGAQVVGFTLAPETPTEAAVLKAALSFGGVSVASSTLRSASCEALVDYSMSHGLTVEIKAPPPSSPL